MDRLMIVFIFLVIACALQLIMYRSEGFADVPLQQCGRDLPPCGFGQSCQNGFCQSDIASSVNGKGTGLPVYP